MKESLLGGNKNQHTSNPSSSFLQQKVNNKIKRRTYLRCHIDFLECDYMGMEELSMIDDFSIHVFLVESIA